MDSRLPAASAVLASLIAAACAPSPSVPPAGGARIAAPAIEPTASLSPPGLRLPSTAHPLRYDLELWLDPHAATFYGNVGIELELVTASSVIWLDATDLVIDSASLRLAGEGGPALVPRVVPGGDDFVGFVFDRPLAPGRARLSVTWRGKIDGEKSRGIYAAREGDGEPYLYTFFETIDARRAFPCFDEPGYKVPWKVSLHVPKGNVALGNAPVEAERDDAGGKMIVLAETKPLPSYLVAFVVGPFDAVDAGAAGHSGTPLRFVVPRGRGGETTWAASVTPGIVGLLEDYFGMPYPYGKLDVAVVPRYWGTMEHPGLVALGQPLTLIAPAEQSVVRQQQYARIAAHELAHYWFGDYVTPQWWDDTWLTEALGTWMDQKLTAALVPEWHYGFERLRLMSVAMRTDALATARAMRQPVESKTAIQGSFDNDIVYDKGQAVMGMFESWMTPPVFEKAIRAYMAAHAFGTATAADFFAALEAGKPGAARALASFVDQPGVPEIEAHAVCTDGHRDVVVTQRRYQVSGTELPPETWKVPVCVRYGTGGTALGEGCVLLDGERASIPIRGATCPAWVMGNADGRGYYRVAYEKKALATLLTPNSGISLTERVNVLLDAGALVDAGQLSIAEALALVPVTVTSRERPVVLAGADLARLARGGAMDDREASQAAHFLRTMYGARVRTLGLSRRPGEGIDDELLRPEMIGLDVVRGDDAPLRARARDQAFAFLKDCSAVAPELVEPILSAAAASNDEALFAAVLERAKRETDHRRLEQLLRMLGGFTSPALVERADAVLASTAFDVREAVSILNAQFSTRETRDAAWTFLKTSFDGLASRMRSDEVGFELVELTGRLCDEAHADDVDAFFAARVARFDGLSHVVDVAEAEIRKCAAGFARDRPSLDAFLARY